MPASPNPAAEIVPCLKIPSAGKPALLLSLFRPDGRVRILGDAWGRFQQLRAGSGGAAVTTNPRAGQGTCTPGRPGLGSCYLSAEGPRGCRSSGYPGRGWQCPGPPRVPSSPPPARPRGLREQIGIRAGGKGLLAGMRARWVGRGAGGRRHGSGAGCFPSAGKGWGGGCRAMLFPLFSGASQVDQIRCHPEGPLLSPVSLLARSGLSWGQGGLQLPL